MPCFFFRESKTLKHDTVNKTASEIEIEKESQSQWNLTTQETALKILQGNKKLYVSRDSKMLS